MKLTLSLKNMGKRATVRFLSHNIPRPSVFGLWSIVIGLWSLLSGCAPTYSSRDATESVIQILKKEYNIESYAKLKDSTLGVRYTVDNLVDPQLNLIPSQLDQMQDVVLTLHRVGLSAGKDIHFYSLVAQDPLSATELVLTGYYLDIKRVRLLDISRNEYFKRIIRELHFNPEILAENICRKLFADLSIKKAELALEEYYSKKVSPQEMATFLFPTSVIALTDTAEFQVDEITTKRIGETKALLFCKTREFYSPHPSFQYLLPVFPQGFQNEYLLIIDANLYPRPIERIIPKYAVDDQSRIKEQPIRQIFDQYPNLIPENDRFYLESYTLPKFLAELIERRIREDVHRNDQLSKKVDLRSVQGTFNDEKKDFTFSLVAIPVEPITEEKESSEVELFETSLKTTAEILKGYWFKDYSTVNFVDALTGSTFSIQREGVDQFRLKKIGIHELLHQSSYFTPFNP